MKFTQLIFNSLRFYGQTHLGVLLGTVLAAAILTGSLLVGDSVDGSLRQFALQRLGNVSHALYMPNRFFAASVSERLDGDVAAALQLRGMAMFDDRQINRVQVIGTDAAFWSFSTATVQLAETEVALSRKLASALGASVGDEVSLRIEKPGLLPRDAPLSAQKESETVRGRFTVKRIIGDDELGRFSLSANQVAPYNAFVSRTWLERRTELVGKANLLLASEQLETPVLKGVLTGADIGLRFRQAGGVVQLESDRVYLGAETVRAAMSIEGAAGSLTYLVNSISKGDLSTPYSFVQGGGVVDAGGLMLGDGKTDPSIQHQASNIQINRWLADALGADVGDAVLMKYFELLPSNAFAERERIFEVSQIVEMESLALARELAPQFPGLTDVDRCAEWDAGFPMEESALEDEANEEYWDAFRQTPKALISLADGQEMWANRFGQLTAVRWVGADLAEVQAQFEAAFDPVAAGFVFRPVREQALAAVDQAMDFGQLFVGMSFFLIVAALLLTGLLFVFGVQQRSEEMGILLAVGWTPKKVLRFLLIEGAAIALVGSCVGAWMGTGYTKLLIAGLSRYWEGAVANSAIHYFGSTETILMGAVASFICALAAMWIAIRRQAKQPARVLLMADFNVDEVASKITNVRPPLLAIAMLLFAIGLVAYALVADMPSVTMPFFGAGALLLVSGVLFCGAVLRRMGQSDRVLSLVGLAWRNAGRRRGRSLAVIGLLACGCFMVFAVSSMKEDVTAHADESWSGTGGFAFFGESTLPIKEALGGVRLRVRDGDDASCLNLNRAQEPRLLGVDPTEMSARKAFLADKDLWELLSLDLPDGMVPGLVGDADTAMWGLEKKVGVEKGDVLTYRDESGNTFLVKLVGMLPMRLSVFQGSVLVAENRFVEKYPSEGYRMFLMGEGIRQEALGTREQELGRSGLNLVPAVERLKEFYAVESTYLAMFLVLGGLGLMVGSLGMGVVVLRNVQDRRGELALLKAVGYRTTELKKLLLLEHALLLMAGLGVGLVASVVAMIPSVVLSGSRISVGFNLFLFGAVVLCGAVCMVGAVALSLRGDALRGLRNE